MGVLNFLEEYYTKEGAGVYKNNPRKKGAFALYFEILANKWSNLIVTNLLYCLLSLPLITNGMAQMGLTYITRNAARRKFAYPVADFFATVKRTRKQGLAVGIINLLVWGVLGFNVYFYFATSNWLLLLLSVVAMIFFGVMNYYVPLMVITFSLKLKQIYKNAFMFTLHNSKGNLAIFGILTGVTVLGLIPALFFDYRVWGAVLLLINIVIYPALRSLLIQYVIFPYIREVMIDPYYEAHPQADRSVLRSLNIETEEDTDTVFEDIDPETVLRVRQKEEE